MQQAALHALQLQEGFSGDGGPAPAYAERRQALLDKIAPFPGAR